MKSNENNILTEEKLNEIIADSNLDLLLSSFILNIKKRKNVVIVCPAGETEELKNFAKYLKNSGISSLTDVIFIYKKGLDFVALDGTSTLHIKEKIPLGTSGAFFTAAYLGYLLGYDIVVVADINVFIDSKKSFLGCVELAKKENKIIFPICTAPEDANPDKAASYNVNGFAFYPRKVFEIAGFHIPYTWRGGEDFEFLMRLANAGLVYVNKNAHISHPRAGYTIFHKMTEKKKFYPYMAGHLKAFLLLAKQSPAYYIKFLAWHLFYSFFADVFSDKELFKTLGKSPYFLAFYQASQKEERFEIKKIRQTGIYPYSSFQRFFMLPSILASLLLSKKAQVYTDEITLRTSRLDIVFGLIKAVFLTPWRLLQAVQALLSGKKTRETLVYPVKPENAGEAVKIFAGLLEKSNLS